MKTPIKTTRATVAERVELAAYEAAMTVFNERGVSDSAQDNALYKAREAGNATATGDLFTTLQKTRFVVIGYNRAHALAIS